MSNYVEECESPPHYIFNISFRGLALESLIVLLKQFIAFFLITWIIGALINSVYLYYLIYFPPVNVSVNLYPLEVLPRFFHYGYGAPFYNFNKIIRTVVFGTKNNGKTYGPNVSILTYIFSWTALWRAHRMGRRLVHHSCHNSVEREKTRNP